MTISRKILTLIVSAVVATTAWADDARYPVSAIPDSLKTGCDAVVRQSEQTVTVASPTEFEVVVTEVVTVLNKNGVSAAAFSVTTDDFEKLSDFRGAIYDAAGKEVERIKRSNLLRSEYSGQHTLADDNVNFLYKPEQKEYPYTVEYSFKMTRKKLTQTYPSFIPLPATETSVMSASYKLITPKGMEVLTQEYNPCWTMTTDENAKTKTTERVWKVAGLRGMKEDQYMPPRERFLPMLFVEPKLFRFDDQVVSNESWESYGQWISHLMEGRGALPPELQSKVHELTDNLTARRDKVKALYEYMCENCRYMNVSLGIGGLQPKPVADTYRTKYGDCKALVFFMLSMLREIGIESNMCLISTKNVRINPDMAAHQGINHVILKVPAAGDEETMWVECTNSQLPFGYIHNSMDGHDVIVIADSKSHLETIPEQTPDYHQTRITGTLNVAATGEILGKWSVEEPDEEAKTKDYKSRKAASQNKIMVEANPFNEGFGKIRTSRKYDIYKSLAYSEYDSITYKLPENYEVDLAPMGADEKCPFGSFVATYKYDAEQHTLTIVQHLQMFRGAFPKTAATEMKRFYDLIGKHRKATVMLKSK